jgi:hypothetical protein
MLDMNLMDVTRLMNTYDDSFQHTLLVKRDAIITALICWLKTEVHKVLAQNVDVYFGQQYANRTPTTKSKIVSAMQEASSQLVLNQTKRNSRRAVVFPAAFIESIYSMVQINPKKPPLGGKLHPTIQCFAAIYDWTRLHIVAPTDGLIDLESLKPANTTSLFLKNQKRMASSIYLDSDLIYWFSKEDRPDELTLSSRTLSQLDPAWYTIVRLYLRTTKTPEMESFFIICPAKKAPLIHQQCDFFVTLLCTPYRIIHDIIPDFVTKKRKEFGDLLDRKAKAGGPNGSSPSSSSSVYLGVPNPIATPATDMTNFFYWFTTGSTLDNVPIMNGGGLHGDRLLPPLANLANEVRNDIMQSMMVFASLYNARET